MSMRWSDLEAGRIPLLARLGFDDRHAHRELAAQVGAFAKDRDRTGVHFDDAFDERQADAQPCIAELDWPVDLREHLEDLLLHRLRNSQAAVFDTDDGFVSFASS